MSVDYEIRVVQGYRVPYELLDKLNELTDYKYEDSMYRCNAYTSYPQWIYFGEEIGYIPCGWATPLDEITYKTTNSGLDWDTIRQELANDINFYEIVATEPTIFVMSCVT